jgi:hypothetical protein
MSAAAPVGRHRRGDSPDVRAEVVGPLLREPRDQRLDPLLEAPRGCSMSPSV